jgi:hypothetical protein
MPVTIKPVYAYGTRIVKANEWTPVDNCGPSASTATQADTAKWKELTICNLTSADITAHVAIFERSTFAGSVPSTEVNPATVALFLQKGVVIPTGVTFALNELYIDKMHFDCSAEVDGNEPLVCVWITVREAGSYYADVIIRR